MRTIYSTPVLSILTSVVGIDSTHLLFPTSAKVMVKMKKVTQRMFYENCKGHVEGHFFGGAERPHISGNFPDFCVEIFHKKLEGFQK